MNVNSRMVLQHIPKLSDIEQCHKRIFPYIYQTPVFTNDYIDQLSGCKLFFKCENFQRVGAFKMRGAANAVFSLEPEKRMHGFACHSSGNHGQAVALTAQLAGVPAYVVMPKNTSKIKMQSVKNYGGNITLCEPNDESRNTTCEKIAKKYNAHIIHPFDDYDVIVGQATAAKELLRQIDHHLDSLVVPVGGGGLASGSVLTTRYLSPNTVVYLTEPQEANDTYQSFRAKKIIPNVMTQTIADGLRTTVGKKNFAIISKYIKDIFCVTEKEIIDAMRLIWEHIKIVVEPSSAVPLAGILKNKTIFEDQKVGVILTGGNVDLTDLQF